MASFESWVLRIFALHYAVLRTRRLSDDNIDLSIKLSGLMTITFPWLLIVMTFTIVLLSNLKQELLLFILAVIVIVVVFGVSGLTDKIYDRNKLVIKQLGNDIKRDPGAGAWWAARQLLKIYLPSFAVVIVAIIAFYPN